MGLSWKIRQPVCFAQSVLGFLLACDLSRPCPGSGPSRVPNFKKQMLVSSLSEVLSRTGESVVAGTVRQVREKRGGEMSWSHSEQPM